MAETDPLHQPSSKLAEKYSTSPTNNTTTTTQQTPLISLHHILLIHVGQIFNYLSGKSYKTYSGFIHTDLGISYRMLSLTVFVSGYVSILNLFTSKYFNRISCNIFIFMLFMSSTASSLLLYFFHHYILVIFISRPLQTWSTMGLWTFVYALVLNTVHSKPQKTMFLSLWNSAYPLSTFALILCGVIIHHLSYFDYLLFSSMVSACFGVLCLCFIPSFTIYGLSSEHQSKIDTQMKQNIVHNMFDICNKNTLFLNMMVIAALDSLILSTMNLLIGVYLKDSYALNPQQLGVFISITVGSSELFTALVIVPCVANKARFHWLIFAGSLCSFCAFVAWNILHSVDSPPPFYAMLVIVFFIYMAHESMFCGILFKNETVAHKSQQAVLASFWTLVITVSGSLGNLTVGAFYETEHGVDILLTVVAVLSTAVCGAAACLCYLQFRTSISQKIISS